MPEGPLEAELWTAVFDGDFEKAKKALDKGANIDVLANNNRTVLHQAILHSDAKIAHLLIEIISI